MFESEYVIDVFERSTGGRLELEDNEGFRWRMARHPAGRFLHLPRVQDYVSPKSANDRFGGRFQICIYVDDDNPDEGVIGQKGLSRDVPERGLGGYQVYAEAGRANVRVMFWGDSGEITPKTEATWATLRSCLQRL